MNSQLTLALDHVAIQTTNLDQALAFYVDGLGGNLTSRAPFKTREQAWVVLGGVKLEIYTVRQGEELLPWKDEYRGPVHLAFSVENLEAFLAEVARKGIFLHPSHPTPFRPPVPNPPLIAYLHGPDGEEVEIREEW